MAAWASALKFRRLATQRYTVTPHPIETLLTWVKSGEIAIPEIQRPFVWEATKVRNLLDSLYRGYPVGYLIAWAQTAEESRWLLEGGLIDQNILDLPEDQRPEILNDRGRQMKAKPIQRLCEDHGMPQLFARPRTPNDNPFIESAFSTAKRAPEYPGRFLDDRKVVTCFTQYFRWCDTVHCHSGIDFVTPEQAHNGRRQAIVEERRAQAFSQRRRRREENQKKSGLKQTKNQGTSAGQHLVA
jgi:hypothetical protein